MRRRRQKNTLLPKMIGIAVLVNAILLPILAQMGVFKTVEQHLQPVQLVNLPPEKKPPPSPKKAPPKKVAKAHPRPHAKVAARQANSRPSRPNPNQPHVVAAAPGGSGPGDNTIDNSGTGAAGQVPTDTQPPAPAPPVLPPPVVPSPVPVPQSPPPPPHVPVVVEARILSEPRPDVPSDLPDDLRDNELHAVFRGVFTIHADGTASLRMTQSTGNDELDKLATDYAHRWTFQPATQDGAPVDSFLRVEMRFDVSA